MIDKLLVATSNQGKVAEFADMMRDLQLEWLGLKDIGVTMDVVENGRTFRDNAILKARAYARETGLFTLADDSGLEVDALAGAPGVHTARYGGEGLTHAERYQLLLQYMAGVVEAERTARFCCVIVFAAPDGMILGEAEGVCEGRIAERPLGNKGFGYDPVFFLPQFGRTMAQLESEVKHKISHRGQAVHQIAPLLRQVLDNT
ncbi:MAG: RdgB/HAM1 family non-canonical purine NTP pyrophosphatase [Chloroflexi bacterium]|nr:RdgB/HAM1 family non-canonical purine NTP pyrophosphatase [Chloroflexota bacterium]